MVIDADRILANMEEQGINQMWLFTWEVPATDYDPHYYRVLPPGAVGIPLAEVLSVGRAAPDRFVLGYMPDVKRPDAVDRLKAAVEIHGIRVASELKQRVLFDDPDALEVYHFCADHKLPITIHLDYPIAGLTATYRRRRVVRCRAALACSSRGAYDGDEPRTDDRRPLPLR